MLLRWYFFYLSSCSTRYQRRRVGFFVQSIIDWLFGVSLLKYTRKLSLSLELKMDIFCLSLSLSLSLSLFLSRDVCTLERLCRFLMELDRYISPQFLPVLPKHTITIQTFTFVLPRNQYQDNEHEDGYLLPGGSGDLHRLVHSCSYQWSRGRRRRQALCSFVDVVGDDHLSSERCFSSIEKHNRKCTCSGWIIVDVLSSG